MKLRILGAYAPYAPADQACNGYLLEYNETRIMLDCGNGSFAHLQKYCDFRRLNALVITHYHPDHFHDYHCIRHAVAGSLKDYTRQKPLFVYAPGEGTPWQEMNEWEGVFKVDNLEKYLSAPLVIGELSLLFQENAHTVTSYAVSVSDGKKKIVYTSDTGWHDSLTGFAANADLLVCEASLPNAEFALAKEKGHLTAGQAGHLAAAAEVKHLVLSHLWPEMNQQLLLEEAREIYPGEITLARGGLSFLI